MKMKDSFLRMLPTYQHNKKSTYESVSHSHLKHRWEDKSFEDKPSVEVDRRYHHKVDYMKEHCEEVYKLNGLYDR